MGNPQAMKQAGALRTTGNWRGVDQGAAGATGAAPGAAPGTVAPPAGAAPPPDAAGAAVAFPAKPVALRPPPAAGAVACALPAGAVAFPFAGPAPGATRSGPGPPICTRRPPLHTTAPGAGKPTQRTAAPDIAGATRAAPSGSMVHMSCRILRMQLAASSCGAAVWQGVGRDVGVGGRGLWAGVRLQVALQTSRAVESQIT